MGRCDPLQLVGSILARGPFGELATTRKGFELSTGPIPRRVHRHVRSSAATTSHLHFTDSLLDPLTLPPPTAPPINRDRPETSTSIGTELRCGTVGRRMPGSAHRQSLPLAQCECFGMDRQYIVSIVAFNRLHQGWRTTL